MDSTDERTTPRSRPITVTDVARRAGVSPGTVSNAINRTRPVDDETRRRVEAAIAELGYVPNLSARRFRTGLSNTIAIFSSMPVAISAGPSRLGFMMEIAASAAIAALEHNMALVLVPPVPDPETALRNIVIDGAILIEPSADDPFLAILNRRGTPTVVIGEPPQPGLPWIDLHYRETTRVLFEHLVASGACNIPLMTGASSRRSHQVTEQAYLDCAHALGMPPRVVKLREEDGEDGACAAMTRLLSDCPGMDGILVPVDALATGVMQALRAAAVPVPGRIRVATRYDGLRAREERPALTAVNLHLDEVARLATARLIQEIAGPTPPAEAVPAPLPALVIRASSQPAVFA